LVSRISILQTCWLPRSDRTNDTPESISDDIKIIQQELPIDAVELFVLTPLPGSEDHKVLAANGIDMDRDFNAYTLENVVTDHAKMSRRTWQNSYCKAWSQFYSKDHLETILRRAHASGIDLRRLALVLLWFSVSVPIEGLHPLQAGILRLKSRNERRPSLPREAWLPFYVWQGAEALRKVVALAKRWHELENLCRRIAREDPCRRYMDLALTPMAADRQESLRLYTQTAEAQAAVMRERRVAGSSRTLKQNVPMAPEY